MNLRYLWIGSVIVLLYALLMSWNQDSARKKELGEAAFIEQIDVSQETPLQENSSLLVIENEKLVVKVSPVSGKVWEARLKEHTYLNNDDSLGVRVFWPGDHLAGQASAGWAKQCTLASTMRDNSSMLRPTL